MISESTKSHYSKDDLDFSNKILSKNENLSTNGNFSDSDKIFLGDNEKFLESFLSKRFKSKEDICILIDHYIYLTMYNLKRCFTKSKTSLVWVCSCISRKEEDEYLKKKVSDFNSKPCERRKVKRINFSSCKFRIRYISDKFSNNDYYFDKKSNIMHNHKDGRDDYNFYRLEFALLSRNIKFNINIVKFIFSQIFQCFKKYKTIDCKFIRNLKNKIWDKLEDPLKNIEKFKSNFIRKLTYFIHLVKKEFLNLNIQQVETCEIDNYLYIFLRKKGANYFSQYTLQILIEEENNHMSFDLI